eukprot:TRINITY_DN1218_c0_g1_i1.p1 TRINITY_DN1218_c0_g1~~TRINITY_DN1218_c0_g1_i1.p1  ORF type:complete len:526 (+),score=139.95 TRINITY_DN1218_c0_g1_i1:290-1867(+)
MNPEPQQEQQGLPSNPEAMGIAFSSNTAAPSSADPANSSQSSIVEGSDRKESQDGPQTGKESGQTGGETSNGEGNIAWNWKSPEDIRNVVSSAKSESYKSDGNDSSSSSLAVGNVTQQHAEPAQHLKKSRSPPSGRSTSSSSRSEGNSVVSPNKRRDSEDAVGTIESSPPRRACLHCGATETSQWRRGPLGPKTQCNGCYLKAYFKEKEARNNQGNSASIMSSPQQNPMDDSKSNGGTSPRSPNSNQPNNSRNRSAKRNSTSPSASQINENPISSRSTRGKKSQPNSNQSKRGRTASHRGKREELDDLDDEDEEDDEEDEDVEEDENFDSSPSPPRRGKRKSGTSNSSKKKKGNNGSRKSPNQFAISQATSPNGSRKRNSPPKNNGGDLSPLSSPRKRKSAEVGEDEAVSSLAKRLSPEINSQRRRFGDENSEASKNEPINTEHSSIASSIFPGISVNPSDDSDEMDIDIGASLLLKKEPQQFLSSLEGRALARPSVFTAGGKGTKREGGMGSDSPSAARITRPL